MFKDLKIGIIGSEGNFGRKRIQALKLNNLQITYCADPEVKVEKSNKGCTFTKNVDEVFNSNNVDLVFIATPDEFKEELIKKGLTAKKHVFVEKPLSKSKTTINNLFELANKHKKLLKVGYNLPLFPSLTQLLIEIKANSLGEFIGFRLLYGHGGGKELEKNKNWRLAENSWGGVEVDLGCHLLELLFRLGLKSIDNISNHDLKKKNQGITIQRSSSILGNKGSLSGSIFTSWYCWKNSLDINLWFENGYIYSSGLLKYLKYGQHGEKLELGLNQDGKPPKIKTFSWNQDSRDSEEVFKESSIDLEFTDLEIRDLINDIKSKDIKVLNAEEREKNLLIAKYLSS